MAFSGAGFSCKKQPAGSSRKRVCEVLGWSMAIGGICIQAEQWASGSHPRGQNSLSLKAMMQAKRQTRASMFS